jgi:Mg/Co/Ni transporter MgtE
MSENQAKVESQPLLLGELIQFNDSAQIEAAFGEMPPVEMARMISSLNKADHIHLLELLGPEKSASIISKISGFENIRSGRGGYGCATDIRTGGTDRK